MSGIQNQISDQTIQAVALLGGATAQSYSAVSLNVSLVAPDLQHADASLPTPDSTDKSAGSDTESTLQSLEKLWFLISFFAQLHYLSVCQTIDHF